MKVSREFYEVNRHDCIQEIHIDCEYARKDWEKKLKLPVKELRTEVSMVDIDFTRNLFTVLFTFKYAPYVK